MLFIHKSFSILPKPLKGEGDFVVSLTSFPGRIDKVWVSIDSILRQTLKPKEIILYLTEEEFPEGLEQIPKHLKKYCNLGLKIKFEKHNLMPHTKYFYCFKAVLSDEIKCDYIVTVDDDIYYRKDMTQHLWNLHEKFPNTVCSNKVRKIQVGKSYNFWKEQVNPYCPSHQYLGLGVSGVLYPVRLFKDKRMFDISLIKHSCLRADDLWLKVFEVINEIPVVTGNEYCSSVKVLGTQKIALSKTNTKSGKQNGNDIQWKKLNEIFDINAKLTAK